MKKHIVYTGSRNLYPMMEVAVKSVIANSSVTDIWLLVEDRDVYWVGPVDGVEFHVLDLRGQKWFPPNGPNMKSKFTYFALCRSVLCHILPDTAHKVLSLDVDTIAVEDIDPVWDVLPDDRYYFAASKEWHRSKHGLLYCNTGVALYNLDKLRDGKADEVVEVINRRRYPWVEQDVFNYLCQGRIYPMPPEYNYNKFTAPEGSGHGGLVPKIVHYAGMQSWENQPDYRYFEGMSWKEVLERRSRRCESCS